MVSIDEKDKIYRCEQCWGSVRFSQLFECVECKGRYCKIHAALPGLFKCIGCLDKQLKCLKD